MYYWTTALYYTMHMRAWRGKRGEGAAREVVARAYASHAILLHYCTIPSRSCERVRRASALIARSVVLVRQGAIGHDVRCGRLLTLHCIMCASTIHYIHYIYYIHYIPARLYRAHHLAHQLVEERQQLRDWQTQLVMECVKVTPLG